MGTARVKGPAPYHVGRFADRIKTDWRLADWVEPKYPGDSILRVDLVRGGEIGDVRVQWYGNGLKSKDDDKLKVGSFTPGYETSSPGDTPKWWPDKDKWVDDKGVASKVFVQYLVAAFRDGWRIKRSGT